MELISVGYENTKYLINQFVLQENGSYLEGGLTVKNQWGLLTGDEWGWFYKVSLLKELGKQGLR